MKASTAAAARASVSARAAAAAAEAAAKGAAGGASAPAKPRGASVASTVAQATLGALARSAPTLVRAAAARGTPRPRTAPTGYSQRTPPGLGFLRDPKLSIEDKLMRLLAHLNQKYEKDIQKKMEELAGTSKSSKKSGLFGKFAGAVSSAFGPLGFAAKALEIPAVRAALGKLGGPVLAAAASALGAPALAPVLLKAGPALLSGATALAGAASASSTSSSGALSDKEKELKMMEIQRLQNHQNEMFRLVSGMLRANHETRLAAIGNIR